VRVTFIPAAALIGIWFLIQLVNAGVVVNNTEGGVAYAAHVGGGVVGAMFAYLFERPRQLFK
jgi:rhomboid family protein